MIKKQNNTNEESKIQMESDNAEQEINNNEGKSTEQKKGFVGFMKKHKLILLLLWAVVSIPAVAYFSYKYLKTTSDFTNTVEDMNVRHEMAMDSLNTRSSVQLSKVFTWAVRSEMIRGNVEQTDQLISTLVKEPNIININMTNTALTKILLSSNKNNQDAVINKLDYVLEDDEPKVAKDSSSVTIYTPIMGVDKKIGVLQIQYIK